MDIENNKYEYHVLVWGGFFNDEYKKIHEKEPGNYWFNTRRERDRFIKNLKAIKTKLNTGPLAVSESEGYNCRIITKLHRVIRFKNKDYYSEYEMGINYPYDAAMYHMKWKWYPGFNDYPLGEEFDYEANKIEVIQEWVTGAFSFKNE